MSALLTVAHGIPALLAEGKDNPSADFSDTPLWITVIKALFIFVYLLVSTRTAMVPSASCSRSRTV